MTRIYTDVVLRAVPPLIRVHPCHPWFQYLPVHGFPTTDRRHGLLVMSRRTGLTKPHAGGLMGLTRRKIGLMDECRNPNMLKFSTLSWLGDLEYSPKIDPIE